MTAKHEHMPEDPPSRDRQVYIQKLPVAPVKQPKHIIARGDRTLLLESCDSTGRNRTWTTRTRSMSRPKPCVVFSNTGAYPGNGMIAPQYSACESCMQPQSPA
jgi:hypothetical protein